jgi:hypothetical protein
MYDNVPDGDAVLARFNRLMQEIQRGSVSRNCFRPWEIEILLDIESCDLGGGNRREILRRYQKAVQRRIERGATSPLKLSEFLEMLKARRNGNGHAAGATPQAPPPSGDSA